MFCFQETPVPGRVLPGVRHDDGRFRALGTVETKRAKEAGEAVLRNRTRPEPDPSTSGPTNRQLWRKDVNHPDRRSVPSNQTR